MSIILAACLVIGAADGDSMKVSCPGRTTLSVRVARMDSPEISHPALRIAEQPGGAEARDRLRVLCLGKPADLVVRGTDKYRRTLASVSCGGLDVATAQIAAGHAWVYGARKDSPLRVLEAEARANRRGLWAAPEPVRPSVWRKRHVNP